MSALYNQVCDRILNQIQTGALKIGDRLPPESDYAAALGVSRSTLRLAFAELEASGVLQRKKRIGTEIISDTPKKRFSMATTGIHELLSLGGRDTSFEINETNTVPADYVPELEGFTSETGHWLEIIGARTLATDDTPFSVNRVYVPARYAAIEAVVRSANQSVFQMIEDTFNVSVARVSQSVRAIACPSEEAKIIGLDEGAPALRIEAQLFLDDGTLMEISVATYDPERFQVSNDVKIT